MEPWSHWWQTGMLTITPSLPVSRSQYFEIFYTPEMSILGACFWKWKISKISTGKWFSTRTRFSKIIILTLFFIHLVHWDISPYRRSSKLATLLQIDDFWKSWLDGKRLSESDFWNFLLPKTSPHMGHVTGVNFFLISQSRLYIRTDILL